MAKASRSKSAAPRRLPRGRHALSPEEVARDQRERLLAAVPGVVAERGYEATAVADLVRAAAVSRNAFYKSFKDKQDCVAAAHEAGHAYLFDVLALPCDPDLGVEERVERSLRAALEELASDPALARFLFVEAPSAGEGIALRYHEWLGRYGTLLRSTAPEAPPRPGPAPDVGQVIVGGIASRIASEVLRGRGEELRDLASPFAEYVLAFYGKGEEPSPGDRQGEVVPLEPEREPASAELFEARKQAGA
jgi:AcrR family transcriptional regulator